MSHGTKIAFCRECLTSQYSVKNHQNTVPSLRSSQLLKHHFEKYIECLLKYDHFDILRMLSPISITGKATWPQSFHALNARIWLIRHAVEL